MVHYSSVEEANASYQKKVADAREEGTKYIVKDDQKGKVLKKASKSTKNDDKKVNEVVYTPTIKEVEKATSDSERKVLYGGGDTLQDVVDRKVRQEQDLIQSKYETELKKVELESKTVEEYNLSAKKLFEQYNQRLQGRNEDLIRVLSGQKPKTVQGLKYEKEFKNVINPDSNIKEGSTLKFVSNPDYVQTVDYGNEFMSGQRGYVYYEPLSLDDKTTGIYAPVKRKVGVLEKVAVGFGNFNYNLVEGVKKVPGYGGILVTEMAEKVGGGEIVPESYKKKVLGFGTVKEAVNDPQLRTLGTTVAVAGTIVATPSILASTPGSITLTGYEAYVTGKSAVNTIENPTWGNIALTGVMAVSTALTGYQAFKNVKTSLASSKVLRAEGGTLSIKSSKRGNAQSSLSKVDYSDVKQGKVKGLDYSSKTNVYASESKIVYKKGLITSKSSLATSKQKLGKYELTQTKSGNKIDYTLKYKNKVVETGSYPLSSKTKRISNVYDETITRFKSVTPEGSIEKYGDYMLYTSKTQEGVKFDLFRKGTNVVSGNLPADKADDVIRNFFKSKSVIDKGTKSLSLSDFDDTYKTSVKASSESKKLIERSSFDLGNDEVTSIELVGKQLKTVDRASSVISKGGRTEVTYVANVVGDTVDYVPVKGITYLNKVSVSGDVPKKLRPVVSSLDDGTVKVTSYTMPRVSDEYAKTTSFLIESTIEKTARATFEAKRFLTGNKKAQSGLIQSVTQPQKVNVPLSNVDKLSSVNIKTPMFKDISSFASVGKEKIIPTMIFFKSVSEKTNEKPINNVESSNALFVSDNPLNEVDALSKESLKFKNYKLTDSVNDEVSLSKESVAYDTSRSNKIDNDTVNFTKSDFKIENINKPVSEVINAPVNDASNGFVSDLPPQQVNEQNRAFLTSFSMVKRKKQEMKGFNVYVKRRGKFNKINLSGLNKASAFNLGSMIVGGTSSASFKVTDEKGEMVSDFDFKKSGMFRQKGGVFIEKNKYRINTPGEKGEITLKGLASIKSRGVNL